tara:strand:+ start:2899 stop:3234 length:336 start_codon:yes stop_codon:yes gene_type:complete
LNDTIYTGQLDVRVEIIERTKTSSSTGAPVVTESVFNTVWAKSIDVSGSEESEGKIFALNVRRYIIKYDPALVLKTVTELFISDGSEQYNIHSSANIGRKEYIELKCSKRE